MLKHCSPSAVDLRRRSRRSVDEDPLGHNNNNSNNDDAMSFQSSSTSSSTENGVQYRDIGTSPRHSPILSPQNKRMEARRKLLPLAMIARQNSDTAAAIQSQNNSQFKMIQQLQPVAMAMKVYAKCLRSDIEYKTLSIGQDTTSKEVVWTLLSKYRMKHRDPKLFYLTMDITIKRTGIPLRRSLSLDDDSRPLELKSCHPWGECKFTLQMRKGAVIRIYDSVLMKESKYKCLLVSENTTTEDVIKMLFHCYGLEKTRQAHLYQVYEVSNNNNNNNNNLSEGDLLEKPLSMEDRPMLVQATWPEPNFAKFVLKLKIEEKEEKLRIHQHSTKTTIRQNLIEDEMSFCSSLGEEEEISSASSDISALRFNRGSERSSRSSDRTDDSGLIKSSPETSSHIQNQNNVSVSFVKNRKSRVNPVIVSRHECEQHQQLQQQQHQKQQQQQQQMLSRQISLHSLLEALPAASVDTGAFDSAVKSKGTSLSSLSLESRTSDYDSYFYI